MGKKNRKKKTGKTSAPSRTGAASASVGAAAGAAVGGGRGRGRGSYADTKLPAGTTLALPSSCCFHGSNLADFKNLEYAEAMHAYISMSFDIVKPEMDKAVAFQRYNKFNDDHEHLSKNADFCQFVFAYCTHLHQKDYHLSAKYEMMVSRLLTWGIQMRYKDQVDNLVSFGPGSEKFDKWDKYNRDIHSERGIIKCLAREIPCNCMDSQKVKAQEMDKTNRCDGCLNHFSKTSLFFCTGCQIGHYCSKACQVNEWPNHRDLCKSLQQQRANKSCIK